MREIIGPSNRVLDVNLTTRVVTVRHVAAEDRRRYLGGKGLAIKYLYERLAVDVDPLGPENVFVVMLGVLLGTRAPSSSRFAAATKSPLTGLVASASCGGPFGLALKTAGYDGLILTGRADAPLYLEIDADDVRLRSAAALWGLETGPAQESLELGRRDGALVIGPAGEHGVHYANVASGERFLGRAGLGAVLGSKRVKAVVARGGAFKIVPKDPEGFAAARKKALAYINASEITAEDYRQRGTLSNLAQCNAGKILPVRNFRDGADPRAAALHGAEWAAAYETRPNACRACAILCGHKGRTPDGAWHKIPEYESVSLLGPNLEIFDRAWIRRWSARCDALGLDTISTGATLGYVMEAGERGLLETPLRFGEPAGVLETLEAIAHRRGAGDELANGTRWLAGTYGGEAFAIHVKGLELPGYDPRGAWGQGLAYAVTNRGGCHLSAALFTQEVFLGYLEPHATRAKAEFVDYLIRLYTAINALQTCVFTGFAYLLEQPLVKYSPRWLTRFSMQHFPRLIIRLLDSRIYNRFYESVTGIPMTQADFLEAGCRIHTLERYMNTREGVRRAADTLPARFLTEGRTTDPEAHTVDLAPMLDRYYEIAGYDADGVPTLETLTALEIPPAPGGAVPERPLRYRELRPGRKPLKRAIIKGAMFALGRAWQTLTRFDERLQREVAAWPADFRLMFKVRPAGPRMVMCKVGERRIRYAGAAYTEDEVDLVVYFKNVESGFLVYTAQMGIPQAYAEHRTSVRGDLQYSLSVVRSMNVVESYIFPGLIARQTVKRPAPIPLLKKHACRLWTYLVGIPFGL